MARRRDTEEQIGLALRQVEAGAPVPELCRKLGIAVATFYRSSVISETCDGGDVPPSCPAGGRGPVLS